MRKYRAIIGIVMATVLAGSMLESAGVAAYAGESAGATGDVAETTGDAIETATAETAAEATEAFDTETAADETAAAVTDEATEAPSDAVSDEAACEIKPEEEGENVPLWVDYYYYKPYKSATYELQYYVGGGRAVIDGTRGEASGKLVIPTQIDNIPVTSIGSSAFYGCSGFTGSLVIPEGVTTINDSAFCDCSGLESISFPAGLTLLYGSALNGCTGLREVINNSDKGCVLPESEFDWIDKKTGEPIEKDYAERTILTKGTAVIAGGYLKPYADATYELKYRISDGEITILGCKGEMCGKPVIPDKIGGRPVTAIGDKAFRNAGFRGKLTLPSGLKTIGAAAFEGCSGLTGSLAIPAGVKSIGGSAFSGCSGLTGSLAIPSGVTIIEGSTFRGCSGLTGKLTLGGGVTEIGEAAFSGCSGLTGSLIIPGSLTRVGDQAFRNCSGFSGDLTLPETVTEIGREAFSGCSGLNGVLYIPSGVSSMDETAIRECQFVEIRNLSSQSIILPMWGGSIKYIDSESLKSSTIATGQTMILNTYRPSKDASYELTYESNDTGIRVSGYRGEAKGRLILPEKIKGIPVTAIGSNAFSGCGGFTGSLTIPSGVTVIGMSAFSGCSGLTGDLTIPAGVTVIAKDTFNGCSGFNGKLTIPTGVTEIYDRAFAGCSGLSGDLTIPESVTRIEKEAFLSGGGFTGTLTFPSSVTIWNDTKSFYECNFIKVVNNSDTKVIPLELKTGSVWVFEGTDEVVTGLGKGTAVCVQKYYKPYKNATYELKYQIIGDHIRITGYRGKAEGKLLIPDKIKGIPVTDIGERTLNGCDFTGDLIIGDNITSIGNSAFFHCQGFSGKLVLGKNVKTIGDNAFCDCRGLTGSLVIPDSVTNVGVQAFHGCRNMTGSLTIGEGVTEIGEDAFLLTRVEKIINNSGINVALPNPEWRRWTREDTGEEVTSGGKGTYVSTVKKFKPASGASYELIYSVRSDDTIAILGCTGKKKGTLVIPEKIEGKTVSLIAERAFEKCSGFTGSLTLPNGITTIEEYAFNCCTGFSGSLTLPESLKTIEDQAFASCTGFTGDLVFPESLTTIGDYAFSHDTGFTGGLMVPGSVTSIGEGAFYQCSGLNGGLTICEGVGTIGKGAFKYCGFTGDVTVPASISDPINDVFEYCRGISRIVNKSHHGIDLTHTGRTGYRWYKEGTDRDITQIVDATAVSLSPEGEIYRPENEPYQFYYEINYGELGLYEGVYIWGVRGEKKDSLTIPDKIGDMDVVGLGSVLFKDCGDWTGTLEIPGSILVIEEGAADLSFHRIINHSDCELAVSGADDDTWNDVSTGEPIPADDHGVVLLGKGEAIRSDSYGPSGSAGFTHTVIEPQVYTGKGIKPDMKVYFGQTLLKPKTDYTIKYDDNIDQGEATFTITGKGKYTGSTKDTFKIVSGNIAGELVKVSKIPSVTFNDREYTPVPVVKYGTKKLEADKDFRISYYASIEDAEGKTSPVTPKETGEYYAGLEGMGNLTGYRVISEPFDIVAPGAKHVDKLSVGKIKDQAYTGESISLNALKLTVKDGKKPLALGTDYTAVCTGKDVGEGIVTIKGMGAYAGRRTVSFKITGTSIKKVSMTVSGSLVYTGAEITPEILLSYKATKRAAPEAVKWKTWEEYDAITDPDEKKEIKCLVSFSNNVNAGKGVATLTGINGYSGTVKKTFTIAPISSDEVLVYLAAPEAGYQKGGAKPKPVVRKGEGFLTEGKDYTLSYANNKSLYFGGGKKKPTVTVRFKGNYKGRKTANFLIIPANLKKGDFEVYADNVLYRNKANNWKTKVTVLDTESGSKLKQGRDYTVQFSLDHDYYVPVPAIVERDDEIYVTVTGKGMYEGSNFTSYEFYDEGNDIGTLKAVIPEQEYTGSSIAIRPSDITWMSGNREIYMDPGDIRIESYRNNIKPGIATVTVKGKEAMGGTKKITFRIKKRGFRWWWEK